MELLAGVEPVVVSVNCDFNKSVAVVLCAYLKRYAVQTVCGNID